MRERDVEKYLIQQVKKSGGLCMKFVSPGMDGVPDRLCLFPGGKMKFVEVKAPGEKPRALQLARHNQLEKMGFPVAVIDLKEQVEDLLQSMEVMKC